MLQDINEISNGKKYGLNDMVRAACNDCAGCHACCEKMGDSILLDPMDMYQLTTGLGQIFEQLMNDVIALHVEDGLIVPSIQMRKDTGQCPFLDQKGRCSIHAFRPGLCRLFPLGRMYEENQLSYFLQSDACKKGGRTKVKVAKWLDVPQIEQYHQFLTDWHSFKKSIIEYLNTAEDENTAKTLNMLILNLFYIKPYRQEEEFCSQFYERLKQAQSVMNG